MQATTEDYFRDEKAVKELLATIREAQRKFNLQPTSYKDGVEVHYEAAIKVTEPVRALWELAWTPKFFSSAVDCGLVDVLHDLLADPNFSIAATAFLIFVELRDATVVDEESYESLEKFKETMMKRKSWSALVTTFGRLVESHPADKLAEELEEWEGWYEDLLSFLAKSENASFLFCLCDTTELLPTLLQRMLQPHIKQDLITNNKARTVELLFNLIRMTASTMVAEKSIRLQAVEATLHCLRPYTLKLSVPRGKYWPSPRGSYTDEVCFNLLCLLTQILTGKEQFLQHRGPKLRLELIKVESEESELCDSSSHGDPVKLLAFQVLDFACHSEEGGLAVRAALIDENFLDVLFQRLTMVLDEDHEDEFPNESLPAICSVRPSGGELLALLNLVGSFLSKSGPANKAHIRSQVAQQLNKLDFKATRQLVDIHVDRAAEFGVLFKSLILAEVQDLKPFDMLYEFPQRMQRRWPIDVQFAAIPFRWLCLELQSVNLVLCQLVVQDIALGPVVIEELAKSDLRIESVLQSLRELPSALEYVGKK